MRCLCISSSAPSTRQLVKLSLAHSTVDCTPLPMFFKSPSAPGMSKSSPGKWRFARICAAFAVRWRLSSDIVAGLTLLSPIAVRGRLIGLGSGALNVLLQAAGRSLADAFLLRCAASGAAGAAAAAGASETGEPVGPVGPVEPVETSGAMGSEGSAAVATAVRFSSPLLTSKLLKLSRPVLGAEIAGGCANVGSGGSAGGVVLFLRSAAAWIASSTMLLDIAWPKPTLAHLLATRGRNSDTTSARFADCECSRDR